MTPAQTRLLSLAVIAVVLVLVTVVVPAVLFDVPEVRSSQGPAKHALVLAVEDLGVQQSPRGEVRREAVTVQVDGERERIERSRLASETNVISVEPGDRVLVAAVDPSTPDTYFLLDFDRNNQLLLLTLAFVGVVLVVARGHGAWSLLGLAASLVVIIRFIIPGILAGYSPAIVALIGALVIMSTTLFLTHGVTWKTTVALAGTGVSLVLTILLSSLGIDFARLSGLVSEEATTLHLLSEGGIDARGLLLAGVIIGALGVLDDVTVAQASAVFEIKRANPVLRQRNLFGRGMNVGRDHIASTVNTLFLAYAGAALPLLLILATQSAPVDTTLSQELVATEIVRSLIGGIGIAAAVPATTALAAWVATRFEAQIIASDAEGTSGAGPGEAREET